MVAVLAACNLEERGQGEDLLRRWPPPSSTTLVRQRCLSQRRRSSLSIAKGRNLARARAAAEAGGDAPSALRAGSLTVPAAPGVTQGYPLGVGDGSADPLCSRRRHVPLAVVLVRRVTLLLALCRRRRRAWPRHRMRRAGGNIDLNAFRPAMDSRGYLTRQRVAGARSHGVLVRSRCARLGLQAPRRSRTAAQRYSIDNIITATLIAAFGIKLGPAELEFGVVASRSRIMNGDRGPDDPGDAGNPNDDQRFKIDGQGLGNVGLHLKTRFLKTSRAPHVGLGVIASVYLPHDQRPKDKFLGEDKLTPQIMGILDKEFGRDGRLRVALNAGIRMRTGTTTFTDNDSTSAEPARRADHERDASTAGTEIPFGVGIAYAITPQKFDVVGEVFGAVPLGDDENYQPLEAIGGVKLYLARNSFLSLGGGRGLHAGQGRQPRRPRVHRHRLRAEHRRPRRRRPQGRRRRVPGRSRGLRRLRGRGRLPRARQRSRRHPRRGRQVPDRSPRTRTASRTRTAAPRATRTIATATASSTTSTSAPTIPRTTTTSRTRTAAPIPTTTRTASSTSTTCARTIPRTRTASRTRTAAPIRTTTRTASSTSDDKCPNEPETYNGIEDEDGCPDRGTRRRDRHRDRDPRHDLLRVQQGGHQVGSRSRSSTRSRRRSRATRHPADRGPGSHRRARQRRVQPRPVRSPRATAVDEVPGRQGRRRRSASTAQGYGETQPIDRTHNEAAWAKNRRVEFLILKRSNDAGN